MRPAPVDVLLAAAAFAAGVQNALAGGGSFLTFPALLLTGLDPRAANIASTIALFPGQVATGFAGRRHAVGTSSLTLGNLILLSLTGGALGALLLLVTPVSIFSALVPWLVLFATGVFAWGSFARRDRPAQRQVSRGAATAMQFLISVYGGYFGGGIGILMLAALTVSGLALRNAGATKNLLAGMMNASAVVIFIYSSTVAWEQVIVVALGALAGGQVGAYALNRVNEKVLRVCVLMLGLALTIGLFMRNEERTFGEVPIRRPLVYVNSLMNLAIALNQGGFAGSHTIESGPEWFIELGPRVNPFRRRIIYLSYN